MATLLRRSSHHHRSFAGRSSRRNWKYRSDSGHAADDHIPSHTLYCYTPACIAFLAGACSIRLHSRPTCTGRLRLPAVPGLPGAARQHAGTSRRHNVPVDTSGLPGRPRRSGMALRAPGVAAFTQTCRSIAVARSVVGCRHAPALPRTRRRSLVRSQGCIRAARSGSARARTRATEGDSNSSPRRLLARWRRWQDQSRRHRRPIALLHG